MRSRELSSVHKYNTYYMQIMRFKPRPPKKKNIHALHYYFYGCITFFVDR